MKKIEIMGCGYIGLPTAITFTLAGYEVCGFDVKDSVVETLNAGHIHIVEPGLQDAMTKAMNTGRLHFTPEPADVFIICVQTPYRETEDHKRVSDMRFVESAAKEVGTVLQAGNLCVLESTSPPYSTRMVERIVSETSGLAPEQFMTAHCPERIIPGRMLIELRENDRIIGSNRPESAAYAKQIYEKVVTGGTIRLTDDLTAEMCKLTENTFRDIRASTCIPPASASAATASRSTRGSSTRSLKTSPRSSTRPASSTTASPPGRPPASRATCSPARRSPCSA